MAARDGAVEESVGAGVVPAPEAWEERRGQDRLPRAYALWLVGILASLVGNEVFYFALGCSSSSEEPSATERD